MTQETMALLRDMGPDWVRKLGLWGAGQSLEEEGGLQKPAVLLVV